MKLRRSSLVLAVWLVLLAGLGLLVVNTLRIGTDLRLFMPAAQTPEQRLLLEGIGEGPASRLLLITIDGAAAEILARLSQHLASTLGRDPQFSLVANGASAELSIADELLPYRYLLSPGLDAQPLNAATLSSALEQRIQDLSSPAASMVEEWLGRDPTLEMLTLAQSWTPADEPRRRFEVWFNTDGSQALLVAQTIAAGFDPQGQADALSAVEHAFAQAPDSAQARLSISGPGAFAVLMQRTTSGEAQQLGTLATVGMLLLLGLAYRRFSVLFLGMLPLLSAGLAGIAAVSLLFDGVHGITIAFGFTLLGVAQDYPLHLFSHQRRGLSAHDTVRHLWPTLATGVASTCIAYLAFLISGVVGMAQLACFTIVGLGAAALSTRFMLPAVMPQDLYDPGASPAWCRFANRVQAWPRSIALGLLLAVLGAAAVLVVDTPWWQNDLSALTPVPKPLLERDRNIRQALGAPDVRYVLAVPGSDLQAVLQRCERLAPILDQLVKAGTIGGYDSVARYLPSASLQLERRARLPDSAALQTALTVALQGQPFRPALFAPFAADVAAARALDPLTIEQLADSPLGLRIDALLTHRDTEPVALISFRQVADGPALHAAIGQADDGATVLDMKLASESLVASYRERILASLGAAAVLLVLVVWIALRRLHRVARVLAPMAVTTVVIVGAFQALGIPMNLFHLIALVLAAGLGLDYALFFEHAGGDARAQARTLHAVLVCAGATLMVFALLATSSIPVLRAIGLTVTIGVVSNFVLALFMSRPAADPVHDTVD